MRQEKEADLFTAQQEAEHISFEDASQCKLVRILLFMMPGQAWLFRMT